MPSAGIKKELSLAKSFGELNKLAEIKDKLSKNDNPKPWINSAEKVYKKAKDHDLTSDEENAYVFYMRFFNIVQEVMKTTKYQSDKKYFNSLIGKSTLNTAIERAEKLSKSLTERYKKLKEETQAAIEKERKQKEKEKSEKENSKNVNGIASDSLQDIDDLLNGKKTTPKSSADVYKKLHVNHSSILLPNGQHDDEKDALIQRGTPVKSNILSIDPVALYLLLNNDEHDILILDTRSKKDFESSCINYPCCINIPDDLLKTSVVIGSIERKLPKPTWDQWIERGKKEHIVILDRNTKFEDIKPESKVQCLKDAIYLYDTSCTLKSEPVFLDGGFESWLWHYPSLVTNPKLPEQVIPTQNEAGFNLDSLSYPELPTLPQSDRPKPPPSETANSQAQALSTPSNSKPSLSGTKPPDQAHRHAKNSTKQNVPPAVALSKESTPKFPDAELPASKTPVAQPIHNNTAQQPSTSPGFTPELHEQSTKINTTSQSGASKVVPNNDVVRQGRIPPRQSVQPYIPNTPETIYHDPQAVTPRQTMPNQPKSQQIKGSGHATSPNNQSPDAASLFPKKQLQNTTTQPMRPPVAPHSSANNVTNNKSPVKGSPSVVPTPSPQVNHAPPSVNSLQQPHHPSGISSQLPYVINGQPSPMPRAAAQVLPQASQPYPPPSMSQQLRPNASGILPKMPARNPSNQPSQINLGSNSSPENQSPAKPSSFPNVRQTFTSSPTGMTHGLPPGWERVLDKKTGRYYFRDHNTKTTHWNPPESLTQTMNQSIMGHNTPTVKESEPKKPSLKRSLSSPNLAKIDGEETKPSSSVISSNRPTVNRRTKPLTESQLANLAPSHGGHGKAMTGLRNLGNSCYMNSVLQCLIATAPLAKYILNSYYLEDINKTNPLGTGGRIAEELAILTRVAHTGNYRHVSPVEFKRTIGRFAPEFGGSKQQDSQEFLLVLLDQFHEDTNRVIKKAYIEEKSNDGLPDAAAARLAWDNHKKRNQSIIVELLQGQFKSTLTCSVCSKQSVTFDAFMSLTLPIPTNASCQIEDCIGLFTKREKVSKDNKWFCPRCKEHREAWKKMEIWKLPPILIVHFNRFKRDFDGSWLEKRQTNVNFPITNLDLSKFVLGAKKSSPYNLYGVSNHYGSMQSGHYTAFCRNIYDRKWYKFDDSDVSSMSESSVKSSAAYILCYTSFEFARP